jgi:hypothetical protein
MKKMEIRLFNQIYLNLHLKHYFVSNVIIFGIQPPTISQWFEKSQDQ